MKLGFIGAGNMAEAIFSGLISSETAAPEDIMLTDVSAERLERLRLKYGVSAVQNGEGGDGVKTLLKTSETVILAVKPQYYSGILEKTCSGFKQEHLVISIMGGVTTASLEAYLPLSPVVRVMPNTPMLVGEGAAGICAGKSASGGYAEYVKTLFSALGRAYIIPEPLMDPLTSVSGCGPAFVYMFIEALADGGVAAGLPRDIAAELAAQTVLGAAKMVLQTGKHPGALKDEVCSPGGGTIAGVASLESSGFRGSVISASAAARIRMEELGKQNA